MIKKRNPECNKCAKETDLECSICSTPICADCALNEQGNVACSKECRTEIKDSFEVEKDGW